MGLHPIEVTRNIEDSYIRYLQTAFHMKDGSLLQQLQHELRQKNKLLKGPYLEVTAPYQTGKSLQNLMQEGIVSPMLLRLSQQELPMDRPLYVHQETAVRKVVQGRNLVVSSGTGSGKTESFLIPILNNLFREKEAGALCPGVRTLLLYPMNALVNDQIKRLRALLANTPEITFGRYTGETEESAAKAEEKYRLTHDGQPSLPNELLSREEMRATPPHILITNYAMLEYLLLRPSDSSFFEGVYSNHWKFIVLDEAHTYNGATGIEVSMLLRRLKDRILPQDRPFQGSLQCIATSATLGNGEEAIRKVMTFASNLFGEPFVWDPTNVNEQDYVQAVRIDYKQQNTIWGNPTWQAYQYLRNWFTHVGDVSKLDYAKLESFGYPSTLLHEVKQLQDPAQLIYHLLEGDAHIFQVREALKIRPKMVLEVQETLLATEPESERSDYLTALIDLAVRAKRHESDVSLLPARYHLFVRAIEGAYLGFLPKKTLFLESQKYIQQGKDQFPVFELGVCRSCGQEHLVGEEEEGKLVQRKGYSPDPEKRFTAYMIVSSEQLDSIVDEDEEVISGPKVEDESKLYQVCPACATITPAGLQNRPVCCEHMNRTTPIKVVKEAIVRNEQAKCHQCGARSANPIRLFVTSQDSATSVLATAMYHELVRNGSEDGSVEYATTPSAPKDSFFNFLTEEVATAKEEKTTLYRPQKLLVFSDSRQDAAFFATYLDRTYQQILWRRLIMSVLHDKQHESDIRLEDLVVPLEKKASDAQLFDSGQSPSGRKKAIRTRLMNELLYMDRRISPEGVGLVSFHVPMPDKLKSMEANLGKALGVEPHEVWTLFEVLFDSFRLQSALEFHEDVDPRDYLFQPRNRQGYMNLQNSHGKSKVSSWLPAEGKMNRRMDYMVRLYQKQGLSPDAALQRAQQVLQSIWNEILMNVMKSYFIKDTLNDAGVVYKMSSQHWNMKVKGQTWYQCDQCGTWTVRHVHGVCPSMRCKGSLIKKNPQNESQDNHYQMLYTSIIPMRMVAKEHTAQLSSDTATEYQNKFIQNEINILSCSTTFEMGVDVGGLEAVFMRNVPPETSNYIQRAGRAGRRKSTTAFALTYAQRRSHDLAFFQRPEKIIAGDVKPPIFKLDNEKIVRRHMHSVAISAFFRDNPDYFKTVHDFFRLEQEKEQQGLLKIQSFLMGRPQHVLNSLKRIVPHNLASQFSIDTWRWVDMFCSDENGILSKAEHIYAKDMEELQATKDMLVEEGRDSDYVLHMIRTLRDQQLLGFLSSHNVLPKYGFPVDVVDLKINHQSANKVSLSRDLKLAISEYAPGSEIVANGSMWKSIAVKRLAKYELPYYRYGHCKCGHYQVVSKYIRDEGEEDVLCDNCKEALPVKAFLVPIFGFVSERNPKPPGEYRPDKVYNSRVFFSDYEKDDDKSKLERSGVVYHGSVTINWKYSPLGKLAVVNSGVSRGYQICKDCGIDKTFISRKRLANGHTSPWGSPCTGSFEHVHLGHEFMSDVLQLDFDFLPIPADVDREHFWRSFLYGLLEGISSSLGIARNNIDGCLYYRQGQHPSVIIFDNVPGGAGYTKEIPLSLSAIMKETLRRMDQCTCSPETSCYGCLRNYGNQYCHDILSRGVVKEALNAILLSAAANPNESERLDLILDVHSSCRNLMEQVIREGKSMPIVGYELFDEQKGVVAISELAWPSDRLAVILEEQECLRYEFESRGWKVFVPSEFSSILIS